MPTPIITRIISVYFRVILQQLVIGTVNCIVLLFHKYQPYHTHLFQSTASAKTPKANPQVYMDIKINNKSSGRIVMQLRSDIVPRTAGLICFGI